MGEGSSPAPVAVWYAVAVCDEPVGRWSLRVSMTVDADGGAKEDRHLHNIDAACDLLRLWYDAVIGARA